MNPLPLTLAAAMTLPLAAPRDAAADAKSYKEQVRPFLVQHCTTCHGGKKPKGNTDLVGLAPDFANRVNRDRWQAVQEQLRAGSMPPKGKDRPPEKEARAVLEWLDAQIAAADLARRSAEGRGALRRLNRVEYENTVRDLLGIKLELKERLPLDSAAGGFDNVGSALHVSSFLMERYLETGDAALNAAIVNEAQPPLIKKRYSLKDTHQVKVTTERVFRTADDGTVTMFASSPWQAVVVSPFYPPHRGEYRIRISAQAVQSSGKPVIYRVDAGPMLMATKNHLVGYFDAPADKPGVIEFTDYLEARSTIRILPYGLAGSQTVHKVGADKYDGPGVAIQWVDVEGPLHAAWPPASHRGIFGDLTQAPTAKNRYRLEVVSKNADADAQRILRGFVRRAFRRSVTDDDLKPFLALVKARLEQGRSFEEAMRVGLKAVLVAPDFLFLREKPGKLDDFALASRLSYFLWSTMPDEELLTLAEQGKLHEPETLRRQVERMLGDPKSAAFTENFVDQWLGLRDIDFTEPSQILYPEFDHLLRVSMIDETHRFFEEILKNDLSLTNFVASDFAMLNARLAKHYGIAGVDGGQIRKVKLPEGSHRGGVLTMASVLKVTANGTNTSPVVRGAWVLDKILGTPPPKPPDGVPAVEPDIRGATTIREQLAKHRQDPTCAACHAKIDPPGFALESFDVIGGWRKNYRSTGRGDVVMVEGRRMPYHKGLKVDPSDVMPDGKKFRDIDEFKQLLLRDKDQLARALTAKLMTYATGASPESADKPEIEAIVGRTRDKNYGLRTLVHEIVQSKAFQSK